MPGAIFEHQLRLNKREKPSQSINLLGVISERERASWAARSLNLSIFFLSVNLLGVIAESLLLRPINLLGVIRASWAARSLVRWRRGQLQRIPLPINQFIRRNLNQSLHLPPIIVDECLLHRLNLGTQKWWLFGWRGWWLMWQPSEHVHALVCLSETALFTHQRDD
jgi:hypothetical protein